MKPLVILLTFYLVIISCNSAKPKNSATKNYSDMEIYCFCFRDKKSKDSKRDTAVICHTPFRLTPQHLLNPDYLLYKTNDSLIINSIANTVLSNTKAMKNAPQFEARFVVLLKKNYSSADTLAYIDNRTLYYNNGMAVEYSFNILDSIKKIIKMEEIDCH